ncbi:hypothetical protein E2C01_071470 [Portunus trituberculatus]|uniref:Uncharacterized protein n=1 Tax=Portunus trituberculatus TaxID=210409 RepID=A0A5B7HVF7_PORTR|nr:hypothetical protein [Portunus trituberculatus]
MKPRPDTATGADRISYSMLQHAGPTANDVFLRVINCSYDTGHLPAAWKRAKQDPYRYSVVWGKQPRK